MRKELLLTDFQWTKILPFWLTKNAIFRFETLRNETSWVFVFGLITESHVSRQFQLSAYLCKTAAVKILLLSWFAYLAFRWGKCHIGVPRWLHLKRFWPHVLAFRSCISGEFSNSCVFGLAWLCEVGSFTYLRKLYFNCISDRNCFAFSLFEFESIGWEVGPCVYHVHNTQN